MDPSSDPPPSRAGGFRAVRSWLRGMVESMKPHDGSRPELPPAPPPAPEEEILPSWDMPAPPSTTPNATPPLVAVPVAEPVAGEPISGEPVAGEPVAGEPVAGEPVAGEPVLEGVPVPEAVPLVEPAATPTTTPAEPFLPAPLPLALPALEAQAQPAAPPLPAMPCPACAAPRPAGGSWCDSCGYWFPAAEPAPAAAPAPTPSGHIQGRYELGVLLAEHAGVERFRALDHGAAADSPVPVIVLRQHYQPTDDPAATPTDPGNRAAELAQATTATYSTIGSEHEDTSLELDMPPAANGAPATEDLKKRPRWPGLAWERHILDTAVHPLLPAVRDAFHEGGCNYLVKELPAGRSLWDAWDDPDASMARRFTWLREAAEQLQALHHAGAMPEAIRPDQVVVDATGRARFLDLADLLPVPVPADAPVRGTLYTAPELLSHPQWATPRANLYSLGAVLYSLLVGRELTDMDFEQPGRPKPFLPRFPDAHPALGRLLMKTFARDLAARFPTDEGAREDETGITELLHVLDACARTLDHVRLEIAAWTSTGMVRSGNEDAFALLHAAESRQEDLGDQALVLLADGMGGYEAGEVAAALALQVLRQTLVQQAPFAALAGRSSFAEDAPTHEGNPLAGYDVEDVKKRIALALREANRRVFTAARGGGAGRRGMGCTAEVVFLTGRHVIVGHVGDSRTYHLHDGRLTRLTRDHTLVNRLVELGTLSPEEAETHPRRNELQQAIGGQPDVDPGLSHAVLHPGDWVVVCSDGLTNHVKDRELAQMLQSEAQSAEMAARRLVNLVNLQGAHDNATVVVIRAT